MKKKGAKGRSCARTSRRDNYFISANDRRSQIPFYNISLLSRRLQRNESIRQEATAVLQRFVRYLYCAVLNKYGHIYIHGNNYYKCFHYYRLSSKSERRKHQDIENPTKLYPDPTVRKKVLGRNVGQAKEERNQKSDS